MTEDKLHYGAIRLLRGCSGGNEPLPCQGPPPSENTLFSTKHPGLKVGTSAYGAI